MKGALLSRRLLGQSLMTRALERSQQFFDLAPAQAFSFVVHFVSSCGVKEALYPAPRLSRRF
jgi:hypothetical protein